MLHIIHVTCSTGFYGAERMLVELTAGIRSRGWRTMIVNLGDEGEDLLEAARRANVPAISLVCRGRYDARAVRLLRQLVIEERTPLVHSHGYKADFFTFAARPPACGVLATCHNWPGSTLPLKFYGWLDRRILRGFDRVVAVSEDVMKSLFQARIRSEKISLIPNGITRAAATGVDPLALVCARQELGIERNQRVALAVGRLSPEKGFEVLINAWRAVQTVAGPVKLIIAGGGPLQSRLEQRVARLGLNGMVMVTGVRRDIPALLAISDVFVMPSLTEGVSMALLEAMDSRTPVVATWTGGIPFVTGNEAILVPPGNDMALAAGLIQAFNNPGQAQAMASRAEKRVVTMFSASGMIQKYMALYDEVLKALGIDIDARANPVTTEAARL